MAPKAIISPEKKKVVKEFVKLLEEYPIVGAVNMENLPTKQLQNMRAQLRGTVVMKMTKRRLIRIAIESVKDKKKGVEELIPCLKGMPALLFTKENPFILYKKLQKNKSTAPAKAGQTAPKEIVVKAGPTPFAPGPVIGELGAAGIKAGIDGGKVVIKADSVVAKEGDVIDAKLAGLLTRLGIEPMEIGLDITAVYEDGSIFTRDVLAVDEEEYVNNVSQASKWAFNLAVEAGIMTTETTEFMVQKAFKDAKSLAGEANILCSATVNDVLAKANAQAASLKSEAKLD